MNTSVCGQPGQPGFAGTEDQNGFHGKILPDYYFFNLGLLLFF